MHLSATEPLYRHLPSLTRYCTSIWSLHSLTNDMNRPEDASASVKLDVTRGRREFSALSGVAAEIKNAFGASISSELVMSSQCISLQIRYIIDRRVRVRDQYSVISVIHFLISGRNLLSKPASTNNRQQQAWRRQRLLSLGLLTSPPRSFPITSLGDLM